MRAAAVSPGRARLAGRVSPPRAGRASAALHDGRPRVPREWSEQRIRESQALFERRGVGIWLAYERSTDELVGFCGFLHLPSWPEPQLMYAMPARFGGRGFATEMARASIAHARTRPGLAEIVADVDEINVASVRVLEKLGFARVAVQAGAFGNLLLLRLPAGR
ncbi:MAG TPA: GNAT family N-acetyltransferase [Methylomirabilota bacterium]|nr:GNAT family N-acetyltransferase [Methylomirabilota bacterium]